MKAALSLLTLFTLMLAGRAMTLAFLGSVGTEAVGAAPSAWWMPLIGDAVIGLTAPFAAWVGLRGRGLAAFTVLIVWNTLGIWDAMSAFLVHRSVPWPDFFMVQIFGASMFFAASAMHLVNLGLVIGPCRERILGSR